jgi:hypothetical protein
MLLLLEMHHVRAHSIKLINLLKAKLFIYLFRERELANGFLLAADAAESFLKLKISKSYRVLIKVEYNLSLSVG